MKSIRFILRILTVSIALIFIAASASQAADGCQDGITISNPVPAGRVALTFDDGPDPEFTPHILDTLKKYNVHATFFLIASKAQKYPELARRIKAEGHLIGNHSLTHQDFSTLSDKDAYRQILASRQILSDIVKGPVNLFRFPEGKASCASKRILADNQMSYLGWNVDTCDWAFSDGVITPEEAKSCEISPKKHLGLVENTMAQVEEHDGGVILLHDNHEITAKNLDPLLKKLKSKSLKFTMAPNQDIIMQADSKSRPVRAAAAN